MLQVTANAVKNVEDTPPVKSGLHTKGRGSKAGRAFNSMTSQHPRDRHVSRLRARARVECTCVLDVPDARRGALSLLHSKVSTNCIQKL